VEKRDSGGGHRVREEEWREGDAVDRVVSFDLVDNEGTGLLEIFPGPKCAIRVNITYESGLSKCSSAAGWSAPT
jgi:hypothetical protein